MELKISIEAKLDLVGPPSNWCTNLTCIELRMGSVDEYPD